MTDLPDQALVTRMCFAEERVAELEALLAWRDISTAPKDDVILGYCPGYGPLALEMLYGRWASTLETTADDWSKARDMAPTHWLPLPAPPPGDKR